MPALAQTKPWLGLDDEDAALGPQHLGALLEDQLDQGRLLAEHGGELARFGAGQDRGELADPALGLGDDLLRDHDDVAVGELGPGGDLLADPHPLAELRQAGDRR